MKRILSLLIILLSAFSYAEQYTLQQCIDSALTNNISIRQQRNNQASQRIAYQQQHYNLLPSVSGNVSQSWSFGRGTGADNLIVSKNMANTSFGVNANLLLFDGLGMKFRIDEARANMQASEAQTSKLEADIKMNITTMFLQVLLNKELLMVADSQFEATRLQLQRSEYLVTEGRLAAGEQYTLQAQFAREELAQIEAQNSVKLSLLDLAQAMDVEYSDDFDIAPMSDFLVDELLPTNDEVYRQALENRPEIKNARFLLQAEESALKSAKAAYSPTISAMANLNTGYYHLYGTDNNSFGQQLGDNLSTMVALSLSIPIFDRMQTPNSVSLKKISIENNKLALTSAQQTLRKEIDQAYYNALAAQKQQVSAEKAEFSAAEAYRYEQQKFDAGRSTAYEFNNAKNTYTKARSEYLQAKYNYLFKTKILKYYSGTL